jgi:(2Fe-2S) ferredoxin
MERPAHHFFVCASFRVNGEPQGICGNKHAADLLGYLENEIIDRNLDAMVTSTGCLKLCEKGPVMIDYPAGKWYGEVDQEKLDAILDALEDGGSTEAYELT